MIYITAIRLSAVGHESITSVKWLNSVTGKAGTTTTADMVTFIRQGNVVQVAGESGPSVVDVVDVVPPHLRSRSDQQWTNNLLALPRY